MTIGEKILCLLKKNNMSYGDLSEVTKIPKSALQRYATGTTTKIPLDRVELIAKAFEVDAVYLLGWDEDEKEKLTALNDDELSDAKRKVLVDLDALSPEQQAFFYRAIAAEADLIRKEQKK